MSEDGNMVEFDVSGMSRRELARQFIRQTGEVTKINVGLNEVGGNKELKAKLLDKRTGHRFIMSEIVDQWLGRVARNDGLDDISEVREIFIEVDDAGVEVPF